METIILIRNLTLLTYLFVLLIELKNIDIPSSLNNDKGNSLYLFIQKLISPFDSYSQAGNYITCD